MQAFHPDRSPGHRPGSARGARAAPRPTFRVNHPAGAGRAPGGRRGRSEKLAAGIVMPLMDASSRTTGAELAIDRRMTAGRPTPPTKKARPSMRILTTLPQNDLNDVPAAAAAAEAAGFDAALTMENRHDPFLALAVAACASTRLELGTAVAIAFPRSPMVVASTCWDLQNASRGRFALGIGPQIRPHNEKRFSVPWSAPVPRLREYVQALRAIWRCWETGGAAAVRGPALHLYPHDAELHAGVHGPAHGADHHCGGRRAFAPAGRRGGGRGAPARLLHPTLPGGSLHAADRRRHGADRTEAGVLRGDRRRVHGDGRHRRRSREGRRVGALPRRLLRLDAGLLAGARPAWPRRSRAKAQPG